MLIIIFLLAINLSRAALSNESRYSRGALTDTQSIAEKRNPVVGGYSRIPNTSDDDEPAVYGQTTVNLPENDASAIPGKKQGRCASLFNLEGWKKYVFVGFIVVLLLIPCFGAVIAASAAACRGNSNAFCRPIHQTIGTSNQTGVAYGMANGTEIAYNVDNGTEAVHGMPSNGVPAGNASDNPMQDGIVGSGTAATAKNFKKRALGSDSRLTTPARETSAVRKSKTYCFVPELTVDYDLALNMGRNGSLLGERHALDNEALVFKGVYDFINEKFRSMNFRGDADVTVIYLNNNVKDRKIRIYYATFSSNGTFRCRVGRELLHPDKETLSRQVKLHKVEAGGHVAYCTDLKIGPEGICVMHNFEDAGKYGVTSLRYDSALDELHIVLQGCKVPRLPISLKK